MKNYRYHLRDENGTVVATAYSLKTVKGWLCHCLPKCVKSDWKNLSIWDGHAERQILQIDESDRIWYKPSKDGLKLGDLVERTRLALATVPVLEEDFYVATGFDADGYEAKIYWVKDRFENGDFAANSAYYVGKDGDIIGMLGRGARRKFKMTDI